MEKLDIIREDLGQTLCFIDKCDEHIFKIKNWALVTSSAIIAYSIANENSHIVLANIVVVVALSLSGAGL